MNFNLMLTVNKIMGYFKKLTAYLKLDKIKYWDGDKQAFLGTDFCSGIAMIITGMIGNTILVLIMLSDSPVHWGFLILPFGVTMIFPMITWAVLFFIAWTEQFTKRDQNK